MEENKYEITMMRNQRADVLQWEELGGIKLLDIKVPKLTPMNYQSLKTSFKDVADITILKKKNK